MLITWWTLLKGFESVGPHFYKFPGDKDAAGPWTTFWVAMR